MKKLILLLLGAFLVIQLFRPAKNESNDQTYNVSTKFNTPPEVANLMDGACNDCHSNKSKYPWYSNVQPAAWWLAGHVNEGKEHLNFSEFTNRPAAYQYHKFEEVVELVKEEEMPLPSYTWFGLHPEAKLTQEERQLITGWAGAQMDFMKANFPADSLVRKRR